MGGRGSFARGGNAAYTYETVGTIAGIKVLRPIDLSKSMKLPEESRSSLSYILLDEDNVFHQYREYNDEHKVVLEIGYHHEPKLGKGDVLHIHIQEIAGVEYHNAITTTKRKLTKAEYEHYKPIFKGVTINEREYFG